jgi:phosphatidylglycerol---prolipoprotein diacylglyceryl transferase
MLPVLFTVPTPWGPQPVYAYGVLLGLSFIVGFQLVERVGHARDGIARPILGNAYLCGAVTGVIGARVLYVLENREQFAEQGARWLDVTSGGLAAYGGVVGALLGAALYLRWKRASLAAFGDAAAPAVGIGTALTRVGCYLYGCDFGTPLGQGAPGWLQSLGRFPRWSTGDLQLNGSPAFLHHVERYGLSADAASSLPVHPTQLYEALGGLLLLGVALLVWRRRRFQGQVILAVGLAYAVLRFVLEYWRDDPERAQLFGFSSAQWFSLLLGAACVLVLSTRRRAG